MMLRVLMLNILLMYILGAGNKSGLGFVMAVLRSRLHPRSLMITDKPALHPKHLRTPHDQNGQRGKRGKDALGEDDHGGDKMRAGPALFNVIFCQRRSGAPFCKCRRQDSNLH